MNDAHEPLNLARVTQDTWIERVHFFDQVDSTNTAALAYAAEGAEPVNELFIAEQQTGGRGRSGNQWWSAGGALTWSVLTAPMEVPAQRLPQVSLTMGLALCEAVELFVGGDVTLKWPNDVYLNGQKVAGILIELAGSTRRLVVGVGLNVNNSIQNAPAEIRPTATSLVDATSEQGMQFDRTAVLVACLHEIGQHLERFAARDASLHGDWCSRSLLNGKKIRIVTPREELTGVCEGIGDDGALLLRTTEGVKSCYGGTVADFD